MYGGQLLVSFLKRIKQKNVQNAPVYDASRKHFLWRMAGIVGTIPILGISYGNLVSIYDYRVRQVKLSIPTLPKTLEGWRIAQISDLHLGSFLDDKALQKGIDLLLAEKPDMVFFTGDLVNYDTSEVSPFMTQLSRIKAPHGVFSTLGNHDYGEYRAWQQDSDKVKNLQTMKKIHEQLGWKLLNNQHHLFQKENAQLAIIGVGNWGVRGKSSKEGNLKKAYQGTENAAVKLLLSHDPSHWDAQVRKEYKDIVATFSGHTHGLQFGIDIGNFRWGLGKYVFNQWADLYYEEGQYLYVNRGFGFSDILPSRIGVLPEITIFTLSKQNT